MLKEEGRRKKEEGRRPFDYAQEPGRRKKALRLRSGTAASFTLSEVEGSKGSGTGKREKVGDLTAIAYRIRYAGRFPAWRNCGQMSIYRRCDRQIIYSAS
jgi:hypothetical protein